MKRKPYDRGELPNYRTYLLTCWQERNGEAGAVTWRFRLETSDSSQRRLFPNLEALFEALQQETSDESGDQTASTT